MQLIQGLQYVSFECLKVGKFDNRKVISGPFRFDEKQLDGLDHNESDHIGSLLSHVRTTGGRRCSNHHLLCHQRRMQGDDWEIFRVLYYFVILRASFSCNTVTFTSETWNEIDRARRRWTTTRHFDCGICPVISSALNTTGFLPQSEGHLSYSSYLIWN